MMTSYGLANPEFLLLLLVLPLAWWYLRRYGGERFARLRLPTTEGLSTLQSWRVRLRPLLTVLRIAAVVLLIFAMARPQRELQKEEVKAEGIDIVLAMDLSSSMLAQDFQPNRLEVSKRVAREFVGNRPFDRLGLVVFAGEAFTQTPLTTDRTVVDEFLAGLEAGSLTDGTAIGMGLATAVNRLRDSEAESKVIVLLTDGVNNTGYQSPELAAQLAQEFGIRVYTIGVGTTGETLAPVSRQRNGRYVMGIVKVEIDEQLLRQIADMTEGRYFRAQSAEDLENIYDYIDQLEKTEIETTVIRRTSEEYGRFLFIGLILLVSELLLRYTILRTIP